MKKTGILLFLLLSLACEPNKNSNQEFSEMPMLIRIAEIEIVPGYLEEYKTILEEEARASIDLEPGVISIFPMYEQENPNQIRILEIYANQEAYQSHLETPHFLTYKESTLEMVKSLKLVEMKALDEESMTEIFKKMK